MKDKDDLMKVQESNYERLITSLDDIVVSSSHRIKLVEGSQHRMSCLLPQVPKVL